MATTATTAPIRRAIVRLTIGSFSLAALLGIIALLGGDFGETQGRVLLTTVLVGVVSVAVLCYLVTAGRRSQPVGIAGGVVVLVPFATALLMIWVDVQHGPSEALLRIFGVGSVVAATLAQACLLLAMAERARPGVRRLLAGTLALAAVLAGLGSALITGYNPSGDGFYRLLGVVAILDVLGTVVAAALLKFGAGNAQVAQAAQTATVTIPADLDARLTRAARQHGQEKEQLVSAALESFLGRTSTRAD